MDFERLVIEIPVYRTTEINFNEEVDKEVKRISIDELFFNENSGEAIYKQKYFEHKNKLRQIKYYPWNYNEIVGWIGIFFLFQQIRAEIYMRDSKRIRKGGKKKIVWIGKLFEIPLIGDENSQEIFELIQIQIEEEKKSSLLKNRFIDLSKFEKVGPHINWLKLMKENN